VPPLGFGDVIALFRAALRRGSCGGSPAVPELDLPFDHLFLLEGNKEYRSPSLIVWWLRAEDLSRTGRFPAIIESIVPKNATKSKRIYT
jgi:hypothetical protein